MILHGIAGDVNLYDDWFQGNLIWAVRSDTDVSAVRQDAAPTGIVGVL